MIKILLIDCSRALDIELRDTYDVHHPPVGLLALATKVNKSDIGKHTDIKIIDIEIPIINMQGQGVFSCGQLDIINCHCLPGLPTSGWSNLNHSGQFRPIETELH